MLTSLKLRNFKAIKKLEIDELKKLTMFIGQNSVGKSSILQSIALLSQSVGKTIQYTGKMVDLGSFTDSVYGHKNFKAIVIEPTFEIHKFDSSTDRGSEDVGENEFFYYVDFSVKLNDEGIYSQQIADRARNLKFRFSERTFRGEKRKNIRLNNFQVEFKGQDAHHLLAFKVDRAITTFPRSEPQNFNEKVNATNELISLIEKKLINIYYFSTMRAIKEWLQELRETECFGSVGEDAISMLHHVYSNDRATFHRIEQWVKDFGLGALFSPTKGAKASILLGDPKLNIKSNLVSQGFGANQLVSVIGQCFASPPESTILIEEPEISLHPGAINTLTDMFLEVIADDKQIILTTHSDRLILELWARVKMGLVDANDVALYLVDKTDEGVSIKEIELNNRIEEIKKELALLYEPSSPLDDLLNVADQSGDADLSSKDLSEL